MRLARRAFVSSVVSAPRPPSYQAAAADAIGDDGLVSALPLVAYLGSCAIELGGQLARHLAEHLHIHGLGMTSATWQHAATLRPVTSSTVPFA